MDVRVSKCFIERFKMKKIIIILAFLLLLTACGTSADFSSESSETAECVDGDDQTDIKQTNTAVSEECNTSEEQPLTNHENAIVYYSREEVADIVARFPHMKLSDSVYLLAPKEIDHVSTFNSSTAPQLSPEEEIEEFRNIFSFFFPDHEFDEECFYAYAVTDGNNAAPDDPVTRFHSLSDKDNLEAYLNGTLGDPEYIHHLMYTEKNKPKESSVSLYYRSPFGNDFSKFNKGVLDKFEAALAGNTEYYASEDVNPGRYYECVSSLFPDSTESFTLLDGKEISIKDAVAFYENYINSIPVTEPPVFKIHVDRVDVFRLDDEHYALKLINSRMYDNIPFDYIWDGVNAGSGRDMSYGVMVETDDVDYTYSTFSSHRGFDETQYTEIVPLEKALRTASEELTDYVCFEVERVELVYRWNDEMNGKDVGEDRNPTYPSWKFTLYNPNDGIYRDAFVDALSGEVQIY